MGRFHPETKQGISDANWEGMLKHWSLIQSGAPVHRPAPKWRGKAKELYESESDSDSESESESESESPPPGYDRVFDIANNLMFPEDRLEQLFTLAEVEEMLDELQAYVESVNVAEVLHKEGRLLPVVNLLFNKHASIQAKTAEFLTTVVENNPTSQKLVLEARGLLLLLLNLNSNPDVTSRTKALGALSALIRNNEPGIAEFRLVNGYALLKKSLSSESVRLQRDALNLIQYLLDEDSSDCNTVSELGLPSIMMHLASSDDAEVREAALRCLLVLARDESGNSGQLVKIDDKLKQLPQELYEGICAMAMENRGAAREESQLEDSFKLKKKEAEPVPPSAATPTVQGH